MGHTLNSRVTDFTIIKESHQKQSCHIFLQVGKRNTVKKLYSVKAKMHLEINGG